MCINNIRTHKSSHRPSVLAPCRGGPSGRSLERGHALLSSASRPASDAAKCRLPRGCVWLPPRSAKAALPLKGARLSVRTAPAARESGRVLLCAVSAMPSALFVLSGCPPPADWGGSPQAAWRGAILLTGGIPPDPRTSYYYDDFHILADGNHHNNMRAKKKHPDFIDQSPKCLDELA